MGCRKAGMTTQEYRASYDYRKEYFKKHPGLFGNVWFCSQCFRPLIGKQNVVVDHITPLNKGGLNHVSNCTSCCRKCNSKKSDKVDGRVIKGYLFKALETATSVGNRGIVGVAKLIFGVTVFGVSSMAKALFILLRGGGHLSLKAGVPIGTLLVKGTAKLVAGTLKAVTAPIRCGTVTSRLTFLAVYILLALYLMT